MDTNEEAYIYSRYQKKIKFFAKATVNYCWGQRQLTTVGIEQQLIAAVLIEEF